MKLKKKNKGTGYRERRREGGGWKLGHEKEISKPESG